MNLLPGTLLFDDTYEIVTFCMIDVSLYSMTLNETGCYFMYYVRNGNSNLLDSYFVYHLEQIRVMT